jgi:hypothetical protein
VVIEIEGEEEKRETIEIDGCLYRKNRSPQGWRSPLPLLFRVRHGALTPRDVKNEGASGDMYENKGKMTK